MNSVSHPHHNFLLRFFKQPAFCGLLALLAFSSCEKAITFKLDESPSRLVVDASIESGKAPFIVLSNSLDYFSEISPDILAASFVHNAVVTLSDESNAYEMKEYAVLVDSGRTTVYYYSNDTTDPSKAVFGSFGKQYQLSIVVNGQTYHAQTTIPLLTKVADSLWWKIAPNNPDTNKVVLMARVTDPPGLGNYVRYFTSVNNGPFYPGLNSVFDDQIVDGTTYDINVDRGVNRNQEFDRDNYAYFDRGDTIVAKLCDIDKTTFDFWRTMEYNYQSIGNPFSSPTTVLGNISNDALGYFGGYAAQYKSLVVPK